MQPVAMIIKNSTQARHWINRLASHDKVTVQTHKDNIQFAKTYAIETTIDNDYIYIYADTEESLDDARQDYVERDVIVAEVPLSTLKKLVIGAGL